MVKLVDTLASGASARKGVEVQVLSWAPSLTFFLSENQSHALMRNQPRVNALPDMHDQAPRFVEEVFA